MFDLFPRLAERRGQLAASLSGGEQQMLAIGRALMSMPRLLLVDELSLGLMPKMVDLCIDALKRLNKEGLAIVLVEQNTSRALDVADQVCVLASGRSVFTGPAETARRDVDLLHSYTASRPRAEWMRWNRVRDDLGMPNRARRNRASRSTPWCVPTGASVALAKAKTQTTPV